MRLVQTPMLGPSRSNSHAIFWPNIKEGFNELLLLKKH